MSFAISAGAQTQSFGVVASAGAVPEIVASDAIVSTLNVNQINGAMHTGMASCYTPLDFGNAKAGDKVAMNVAPDLLPVPVTNLATDDPNLFRLPLNAVVTAAVLYSTEPVLPAVEPPTDFTLTISNFIGADPVYSGLSTPGTPIAQAGIFLKASIEDANDGGVMVVGGAQKPGPTAPAGPNTSSPYQATVIEVNETLAEGSMKIDLYYSILDQPQTTSPPLYS